jgi:hypothetical protein
MELAQVRVQWCSSILAVLNLRFCYQWLVVALVVSNLAVSATTTLNECLTARGKFTMVHISYVEWFKLIVSVFSNTFSLAHVRCRKLVALFRTLEHQFRISSYEEFVRKLAYARVLTYRRSSVVDSSSTSLERRFRGNHVYRTDYITPGQISVQRSAILTVFVVILSPSRKKLL